MKKLDSLSRRWKMKSSSDMMLRLTSGKCIDLVIKECKCKFVINVSGHSVNDLSRPCELLHVGLQFHEVDVKLI